MDAKKREQVAAAEAVPLESALPLWKAKVGIAPLNAYDIMGLDAFYFTIGQRLFRAQLLVFDTYKDEYRLQPDA